MKSLKIYYSLCFFFSMFCVHAQDVFGQWQTLNSDGKVNSVVEIYKEDGKVNGKVVKIINEEDRDRKCVNCEGEMKNKPIEGLEIMKGLEQDGNEYVDGKITDPKSGKEYTCKIWLEEDNPDILHVRGYIAFFYKTRTWKRLN